jgi:N-acetyl-anhydromuramyl-L-alanine amidase AmpD
MSRPNLQDRVTRLDCAIYHGGPFPDVPTILVMHINDGGTFASSILYLNTTHDKKASYHYGIEKDGRILRMTDPGLVAWHAGDSAWPNPIPATAENPDKPNGGASVNHRALGICWASQGEPITDAQIESGLWLCDLYMQLYGIPVENVRGHLEVSPIRKSDPPPSSIVMDEWRALLTKHREDA